MTLNEIAYTIAGLTDQASDDVAIARIKDQVVTARAMLIRRSYQRNAVLPEQLMQDLKCQELEKSDITECCSVTLDGCKVMKTGKLPTPVTLHREVYFRYVGSVGKRKEFTYAPHESLDDLLSLRYIKTYNIYTYLNNQVYVISNQGFGKKVNIRGVFSDPREAAKYTNCEGDPCYTDDDQFPLPESMVDPVIQMVLQRNAPYLQIDTNDEINEESKGR